MLTPKSGGPIRPLRSARPTSPFVEGELLVRLKSQPTLHTESVLEQYGATVEERFEFGGLMDSASDLLRVQLPEGSDTEQVRERMRQDPAVAYAETNDIYQLQETKPNDLGRKLWNLKNRGNKGGKTGADIAATQAWDITTGDRENGPIIAVIDSGVDLKHPDLRANLWTNPGEIPDNGIDDDGNGVIDDVHGYNAYDQNGDPQDSLSHGTHVAGTIGATGDNGKGVVGVNWATRMMPIRIFNEEGRTTAATIVRGINYATTMGARLTNNSWGGTRPNEAIKEAFAASDALHLCASGNNGMDTDVTHHYPSSYELDNVVSVGATTRRDRLARFSNYGATQVDVAAPGEDIYSTIPGPFWKRYGLKSGTSMATPAVTGVAGLVLSAFPDISNQELKDRLIYSSDPVRLLNKKVASNGRVNAFRALETDTTPPQALGPITSTSDYRGVDLSWSASGDDGLRGLAGGYELRVGEAGQVHTPTPKPAGQAEAVRVELAPSEAVREVAVSLQAVDNAGNRSPQQTKQLSVPAAKVHLLEDFENGLNGWTRDGAWDLVKEEGRGYVFTDSPGGKYKNSHASSLTSPPLSLKAAKGSTVVFDAKYQLALFDGVELQAKGEDGEWRKMKRFYAGSDWKTHAVDISRYDGQELQLRFRLGTNKVGAADGFSVDAFKVLSDPNF